MIFGGIMLTVPFIEPLHQEYDKRFNGYPIHPDRIATLDVLPNSKLIKCPIREQESPSVIPMSFCHLILYR